MIPGQLFLEYKVEGKGSTEWCQGQNTSSDRNVHISPHRCYHYCEVKKIKHYSDQSFDKNSYNVEFMNDGLFFHTLGWMINMDILEIVRGV